MHFMIFVPYQGNSRPKLDEIGLYDFIGGESVEISNSPTQTTGTLWGWRKHTDPVQCRNLVFDPNRQEWVESADKRYWVGFWKGHKVYPEDLQKQQEITGLPVTLQDGCQWVVPVANDLPRVVMFNGDEAPVERRLDGVFNELWDESCRIANLLKPYIDSEAPDMKYDERFAFYALALLRWHYRILPEVVNHYSLFSDASVAEITAKSLHKHELLETE